MRRFSSLIGKTIKLNMNFNIKENVFKMFLFCEFDQKAAELLTEITLIYHPTVFLLLLEVSHLYLRTRISYKNTDKNAGTTKIRLLPERGGASGFCRIETFCGFDVRLQ
ncbi:hypothetical protein FQA47_011291 [Oryzias melastigma]|uniref:Uncharacterized protein n=1 Tax=Oryzias melastigma TaxID=30732 RepID=A0A834CP58_ORYME|nr:hypothetical protein FQA47_011291 [Oryzias melastigma]